MTLLSKNDKIYIAGSSGMVGNALCKLFDKKGYSCENNKLIKSNKKELDLTDKNAVHNWFIEYRPNIVILAAAKVGGILANRDNPVDFLLENLKIQNNIIETSWQFGVKRLLFLGSSCIYPKFAQQPIKEKYLLNSNLENSNQWYALAKIAGLKLCEAYRKQYGFDTISLMPTNLYGPNDNYNLRGSHVMASLIRRFYEAKQKKYNSVTCWGTGKPLREFLFIDDFADACFEVLTKWDPNINNSPKDDDGNILNWLNIGSEYEISIKDLAEKIAKIIDYKGEIIWDKNMPDGTPRKKLDNRFINQFGWKAKTDLDSGIKKACNSYKHELKIKSLRY